MYKINLPDYESEQIIENTGVESLLNNIIKEQFNSRYKRLKMFVEKNIEAPEGNGFFRQYDGIINQFYVGIHVDCGDITNCVPLFLIDSNRFNISGIINNLRLNDTKEFNCLEGLFKEIETYLNTEYCKSDINNALK